MLPPIPVVLAPYDPKWPQIAAKLSHDLRVLGSCLVTVHHIGSTSVPGLVAKPTIDLIPVVNDLTVLDKEREHVEALGYKWHGEYGISGRRFCTLSDEDGKRIAHLHFFNNDSPHVLRHLAFRDYLRAHPDIAASYDVEKRRARDLHPNDSHAYTDEKSMWIRKTETQAIGWFGQQKTNATPC